MTLASNKYYAELVQREHTGAPQAWCSARGIAARLSGGVVPGPRSADVVVTLRQQWGLR